MLIKFQPFEVKRPWGHFRQFTKNTPTTIKIVVIKPNEILSLQSHAQRAEFWHVITGSGRAEIKDIWKKIKVGDELFVPVKAKHRLEAGDSGLEVMEISVGDFDENDIIHYEDKYGRL